MTLGPLMCDIDGQQLSAEDRELLGHPFVGGAILFSRNYESPQQIRELVRDVHKLRTPPLLVAVDQEGGRVQRLRDSFTELPAAHLIGRHYDVDAVEGRNLAEQVGWIMAAELIAIGIDISFAPVLDLDWGLSEVIGDRAFHRNPEVVVELGTAFMTGMRAAGMAATAKHFPGHGHVVADSHHALPVDRRPWEELLDDISPFERLIDAGLPAIMMAHVSYSAVDDRPAGFSSNWIQGSLRERYDFRGPVFSDDLSMVAAQTTGSMPDRAQRAVDAGCDMILVCNDRPGSCEIIDVLGDHDDPVSQVRLASMHGKPGPDAVTLTGSEAWQNARRIIGHVLDQPQLELDA